jgi:hypothetical protein
MSKIAEKWPYGADFTPQNRLHTGKNGPIQAKTPLWGTAAALAKTPGSTQKIVKNQYELLIIRTYSGAPPPNKPWFLKKLCRTNLITADPITPITGIDTYAQ